MHGTGCPSSRWSPCVGVGAIARQGRNQCAVVIDLQAFRRGQRGLRGEGVSRCGVIGLRTVAQRTG